MGTFYHILLNSFITTTKNTFVWFALTYWAYLSTHSVIATSVIGGLYLVVSSATSIWFGHLVDRHRKKTVLLISGIITLVFLGIGLIILSFGSPDSFASLKSPILWLFILIILSGVITGNISGITTPTLISVLVPKDKHDKANGMLGTVNGISFAITSAASGIALGFGGLTLVLVIAGLVSLIGLAHLIWIRLPEPPTPPSHSETETKFDVSSTFRTVRAIPGLMGLIFFTTFNNFVGGVFMALMDAYGLTLVSVQVWGLIWGALSFGFIFGGLYISRFGLGSNPIRRLIYINIILWTICIFFTIQPSIILLSIGCLIWMSLMPFIEAIEQTIIQKVVPTQRQGRVFGFAHSIEQAAAPLTAFLIGPIADLIFIPFMTTGKGVELIGSWYGVGPGRGIALVFSFAGLIGLAATIMAKRSHSYRLLSQTVSS